MKLTPLQFLDEVIRPALLAPYLPIGYDSPDARVMLLAWALACDLPAPGRHGPWAFDLAAVQRVTFNPAVDDAAAAACRDSRVLCNSRTILQRLDSDPLLACRLARLALETDPNSLPKPDPASEEQAWQLVLRVEHAPIARLPDSPEYRSARDVWSGCWAQALEVAGA